MARRQPPPTGTEAPERRIGILTGWRCWTVLRQECLLRPIWKRGLVWKPREPYEAFCAGDDVKFPERVPVHEVPNAECRCGIWAVCHPMLLREAVDWDWKEDEILVVGQVALWGKVIEFERGWRARFAYPVHLYAISNDQLLAHSLRERYGVSVAFGAQTRAFAKILPVGLKAAVPAPAGVGAVDEEMPSIPLALNGIVEMVQTTEIGHLERLREDVQAAQQRLRDSRAALRIERERRRLEHEQQLVDLERTRLELERQRERLGDEIEQRAAEIASNRVGDAAHQLELKRSLREHGISQAQVAAAARVDRVTVNHFLNGRRKDARIEEVCQKLLALPGGSHETAAWAARVHARLLELRWTRAELAARLGVSAQMVHLVLRGRRPAHALRRRIDKKLAKGVARVLTPDLAGGRA